MDASEVELTIAEDECHKPEISGTTENMVEATAQIKAGKEAATESDKLQVEWKKLEAELNDRTADTEESNLLLADIDGAPAGTVCPPSSKLSCSAVSDDLGQFQMPTLKVLNAELSQVQSNKRIIIYPLSTADLIHSSLVRLMGDESPCMEYRLKFVRHEHSWHGFLNLFFASKGVAQQAVEMLASFTEEKPDIKVEFLSDDGKAGKVMSSWNHQEAIKPDWPSRTLFIKNFGPDVTVDKLRTVFPDAEDVVLPRSAAKKGKTSELKGYAYAIYLNAAQMQAASERYSSEKVELDGKRLKVMKYAEPVPTPEGLLKLVERKLILKHGSRMCTLLEKRKVSGMEGKPGQKHMENKLRNCILLLERDNAARRRLALPTPSLSELSSPDLGLPELTSKQAQAVLVQLGVIKSPTVTRKLPNNNSAGDGFYQQKRNVKNVLHSGAYQPSPLMGGYMAGNSRPAPFGGQQWGNDNYPHRVPRPSDFYHGPAPMQGLYNEGPSNLPGSYHARRPFSSSCSPMDLIAELGHQLQQLQNRQRMHGYDTHRPGYLGVNGRYGAPGAGMRYPNLGPSRPYMDSSYYNCDPYGRRH